MQYVKTKKQICDETYLVSEDRLEGERSSAEPSRGTISASGQREGLFHVKSTHRNAWVLVLF